MVEPEIYEFLAWITGVADSFGLVVLPEVHDRYPTHERLIAHGYWTYDFVLPGLLLHAFETGDADRLAAHLARSPDRQFTSLDCHDGIPVRPDLDGILAPAEMIALADSVVPTRRQRQSDPVGRSLGRGRCSPAELHVLLGAWRRRRAVPRGARDPALREGRPADLLRRPARRRKRHGGGRADGRGPRVNRHDYSVDEIETALRRPVVGRLLELIRLRNTHPAFEGALRVEVDGGSSIRMEWAGEARAHSRSTWQRVARRSTTAAGGARSSIRTKIAAVVSPRVNVHAGERLSLPRYAFFESGVAVGLWALSHAGRVSGGAPRCSALLL